jgi:DNA-binding response OmpR family regulator
VAGRKKAEAGSILIVEDDPTTAELISEALSDAGYELLKAREGGEALRLARECRPSAITLDLELAGLDGRSFLLGLRADEATKRTPVIVVSANSENLNTFERRTVARVLPKPFDVSELRATVDGLTASPPAH